MNSISIIQLNCKNVSQNLPKEKMQNWGTSKSSHKQNEEDKKKYYEYTKGFDAKNNLAVEFLGKRTQPVLYFMAHSFAQEYHKNIDRFIYRRKPSLLKYIHENINEFKEFFFKEQFIKRRSFEI